MTYSNDHLIIENAKIGNHYDKDVFDGLILVEKDKVQIMEFLGHL